MQEVKINPFREKNRFLERYTAAETNSNAELQELYSRLFELEGMFSKSPVILQGNTLELYKKHLS